MSRLKINPSMPIASAGTVATPKGAVGTPLFIRMTNSGGLNFAGNLNETATVSNAAGAMAINALSIAIVKTNFAQFTELATSFFGATALTNGLKFGVVDAADAVVLDLTYTFPIKTTGDMGLFSTSASVVYADVSQGTASNNQVFISYDVNFTQRFGGALYIPRGYKFALKLEDNLTVVNNIDIAISGLYLG